MAAFYFYRIDPDLHLYRPVQFFDPVYPGQKILVFGDRIKEYEMVHVCKQKVLWRGLNWMDKRKLFYLFIITG
jgi:hypothetical protein